MNAIKATRLLHRYLNYSDEVPRDAAWHEMYVWPSLSIIRKLLNDWADYDVPLGDESRTALHVLAANGDIDNTVKASILKLMQPSSEQLCFQDIWGATAVHYMSSEELAVINFVPALHIEDKDGAYPLHRVVDNHDLQGVYEILKAITPPAPGKAEPDLWGLVDIQDNQGKTPLHYLGFRGSYAIALLLLKQGADPNVLDDTNTPAYIQAVRRCYSANAMTDLCMRHGVYKKLAASIWMTTSNDDRFRHGVFPEILNAEPVERWGTRYPKRTLNPEYAQKFQSNCADRLAAAENGEDLLWLYRSGLDFHSRDAQGNTALHLIMRSTAYHPDRPLDLGHVLIRLGLDINAKNDRGETALMLATRLKFQADTIALFLEFGADPDLTDLCGKTALDHAKEMSYRNWRDENIWVLTHTELFIGGPMESKPCSNNACTDEFENTDSKTVKVLESLSEPNCSRSAASFLPEIFERIQTDVDSTVAKGFYTGFDSIDRLYPPIEHEDLVFVSSNKDSAARHFLNTLAAQSAAKATGNSSILFSDRKTACDLMLEMLAGNETNCNYDHFRFAPFFGGFTHQRLNRLAMGAGPYDESCLFINDTVGISPDEIYRACLLLDEKPVAVFIHDIRRLINDRGEIFSAHNAESIAVLLKRIARKLQVTVFVGIPYMDTWQWPNTDPSISPPELVRNYPMPPFTGNIDNYGDALIVLNQMEGAAEAQVAHVIVNRAGGCYYKVKLGEEADIIKGNTSEWRIQNNDPPDGCFF